MYAQYAKSKSQVPAANVPHGQIVFHRLFTYYFSTFMRQLFLHLKSNCVLWKVLLRYLERLRGAFVAFSAINLRL